MSDATPPAAGAGIPAESSAAATASPAAATPTAATPMQTDNAAAPVAVTAAPMQTDAPAPASASAADAPIVAATPNAAGEAATAAAAAGSVAAPAGATAAASGKGKGKGRGRNWDAGEGNKRQKANDPPGGKRGWQPRVKDADASDDEEGGGGGGVGRAKKRKVALAVMYRGTAYCGLQLQNGAQQSGQLTIERVLLDAIHAAGGISKDNMDSTHKIKWMRAARTDKGVHAAGNIMSLMMCCDAPPPPECPSQSDDIVERINACLPADVRVIGYARVLGGFHAKYSCTSRVYEYILPSFVFDSDPATLALMHEQVEWAGAAEWTAAAGAGAESGAAAGTGAGAPASGDKAAAKAGASVDAPYVYPQRLLDYRLTDSKRSELRTIMSSMKGTLNFQNFTRKKSSFLKEAQKDAAKARAKQEAKKEKKEEGSEEEGEGMDDAAEEALERQQYAAAAAAAAAASSSVAPTAAAATGTGDSASSTAAPSPSPSPSPFAYKSGGRGGRHAHNPLLVNLKASNSRSGAGAGTNKASGQYARFIRYIMDFDIEDVYMHTMESGEAGGSGNASSSSTSSAASGAAAAGSGAAAASPRLEFVRLRVHGQSFMLNQIRKMVGALVIIARGQLPLSFLTEKALKYDEYAVPTAPSLGLLLDRPVYADYDKKVSGGAIADRMPVAALFTQEPYAERVNHFRAQCIYKQICDAEVRTGSAARWCSMLWSSPSCMQQRADDKEEEEEGVRQQQAESSQTEATADGAAQESQAPAAAAAANDAAMSDVVAPSAVPADAPVAQQ